MAVACRLCVLALCALPCLAHAEVQVAVQERYYEVPYTGGKVYEALRKASPVREDGQVFFAHTSWHVAWAYRWHAAADGRCRITLNTTTVKSEILLPHIAGDLGALRMRYDTALEATRSHEMGHHQVGVDAAQEVDRYILGLPEQPDCKRLSQLANDGGKEILRQANTRDVSYDARTQHGRSQGAWFDF